MSDSHSSSAMGSDGFSILVETYCQTFLPFMKLVIRWDPIDLVCSIEPTRDDLGMIGSHIKQECVIKMKEM